MTCPTKDHRIETPDGGIFAREWKPVEARQAPILLFHDSLGSVALWRSFPESLAMATGCRVIAYDRLGFGQSDPRDDILDIDFIRTEASAVVPLIRTALGVDRFVACGHSVGGGIAVETAAHFAESCAALVTMGAQAWVDERIMAGIREAKAGLATADGLSRLQRYHGDKARWVVDAWTETWLADWFRAWTLDQALARIRCPVLAIHGADDEYGSTDHARHIAGAAGQTTIMPGVGHLPHREAEAQAVEIIGAFLAGLPAA